MTDRTIKSSDTTSEKVERISQARREELMARRTVTLDLTIAQLALLTSLACDEGLSLGQLMTKFGLDLIADYRSRNDEQRRENS